MTFKKWTLIVLTCTFMPLFAVFLFYSNQSQRIDSALFQLTLHQQALHQWQKKHGKNAAIHTRHGKTRAGFLRDLNGKWPSPLSWRMRTEHALALYKEGQYLLQEPLVVDSNELEMLLSALEKTEKEEPQIVITAFECERKSNLDPYQVTLLRIIKREFTAAP